MIPGSVNSIGDYAFFDTDLTNVTIPNGVKSIGNFAFYDCYDLSKVTISGSVTNFGSYAIADCYNLTGIYFLGNAPTVDSTVFSQNNTVTVYYLPGSAGWRPLLGGLPTAPWLPQIQTTTATFGVLTNCFCFKINWASGQTVVVEASTNLQSWTPVITNTLVNGTNAFGDSEWANYPQRFYRVRSQ
jgi:hypothetical protein